MPSTMFLESEIDVSSNYKRSSTSHYTKCVLLIVFISISITYYYVSTVKLDLNNFIGAQSKIIVDLKKNSIRIGNCSDSKSGLTFTDVMKAFPWQDLNSTDLSKIQHYSTLLAQRLLPYLTMPPTVPINKSCIAPPLQMPSNSSCKRLAKPRKVGMLLQFGFDINALEIHLHELNAVVDKFFLIEAVQSHSIYTSTKSLVWESVKNQERFANFSEKVVHFVVDDASLSETNPKKSIWERESQQERLRWKKFLQWNHATQYFSNEDILGFGDTDEIPNRNNVYFLKNCQLPSDPIDIGLWFPMDGLDSIFASDFPIKGHPFTIANPSFWTISKGLQVSSANESKYPNRLRGRSQAFLLGGVHLSRNTYPPHYLIRLLTATEAGTVNIKRCMKIGMLYATNQNEEANDLINDSWSSLQRRIITLEQFRAQNMQEAELIVKIPWLLSCNLRRYPSYNKQYDERLNISLPI